MDRTGYALFRRLYREMKTLHPNQKLRDAPAYNYMIEQFKKYRITGKKVCRGEQEMKHVGETYLCLLQSNRMADELINRYSGTERSVQDSARLVGLELPVTGDGAPNSSK